MKWNLILYSSDPVYSKCTVFNVEDIKMQKNEENFEIGIYGLKCVSSEHTHCLLISLLLMFQVNLCGALVVPPCFCWV